MKASALVAVCVCGVLIACTAGPRSNGDQLPSTSEVQPFSRRISKSAEVALQDISEEQGKRAERARLREVHRKQGLRVCEEGEHGTEWTEDCNTCHCEHGVRVCTKAYCRKRELRELPPDHSVEPR